MTSQARCANCGQQLIAGARFCQNCGAQVENPAEPLRPGATSGVECPSCHHNNPPSSSFCEACGTQLSAAGVPPGGAPAGTAPASEDPWATGPAYAQPIRADQACPRCGSFRNPGDTACANCGLPFGDTLNYTGVPPAVAMQGTPAGFWIRFVAYIIDSIIVGVVFYILLFVLGGIVFATSTGEGDFAAVTAAFFVFFIALVISVEAYYVLFLAYKGATPGKMILNIRVMDDRGNRAIGIPRALGRELSKFISGFFYIGYIMAAFRRDKRALHDLIAGTYPTIVNRRR